MMSHKTKIFFIFKAVCVCVCVHMTRLNLMILRKLFSDFDVFDKLQKTHQLVTNKYLPLFVKFDGRFIVEKKNKTDYMYRIWEIHTGWKTNFKKKSKKKMMDLPSGQEIHLTSILLKILELS